MSGTAREPLAILPVPAFQDNYIWLVRRGRLVVVVDPGDATPVIEALARLRLQLVAIVLTHHHADHMGGVAELAAQWRNLPVYGPAREQIRGVTIPLTGGERFTIAQLGLDFSVIDVPGHTSGHIAYYSDGADGRHLFCGDTMFACGCGRLFEGSAEQMQASLASLVALPPDTRVYCAHEYTLANIRFAQAVDPANAALEARAVAARQTRADGLPTLPSSIELELSTNPFVRWNDAAVRAAAEAHAPGASANPVATFAALRSWKDGF